MLQTIEIIPHSRRSVRRAVTRCEVDLFAAPWSDPRKHRILDLSPDGMRVAAGTRLPQYEPLVVSFTPPGWWMLGEVTLFAEVVRSSARQVQGPTLGPATMGVSFLDMPKGTREQLARTLRGRPPPIPRKPRKLVKELVWIDMLVSWTEDLGDRVNAFELSQRIETSVENFLDDLDESGQPLAALLH